MVCRALLVLAALVSSPLSVAVAQNYPVRPVRLIVPVPPGGGQDIMARALAQRLSDSWGQTVVVDNRSGASAVLGTELLARAAPDGYTLILISSTHVIAPSLNKVPYDPIKDFTPVTQVSSQPYLMGIHPSLPAKSVQEFVELAKSRPGQLNYGSAGNGTAVHLAGELLESTCSGGEQRGTDRCGARFTHGCRVRPAGFRGGQFLRCAGAQGNAKGDRGAP